MDINNNLLASSERLSKNRYIFDMVVMHGIIVVYHNLSSCGIYTLP